MKVAAVFLAAVAGVSAITTTLPKSAGATAVPTAIPRRRPSPEFVRDTLCRLT